jgi:hypothetical protein
MPAGFVTKTVAVNYIGQRTGYGRRVVERKLEEMQQVGDITFVPDPGRIGVLLLSQDDVEKVVAALTIPRPS